MLDEPFAGIDPVTVQNIQVVIRELAENDIAILITDHAAREILQITDRTYVVNEGRILVSGTPDEIVRHEQVRSKYLGDIDFSHPHGLESHGPIHSSVNTHVGASARPQLQTAPAIKFTRTSKRPVPQAPDTERPIIERSTKSEDIDATPQKRKPITSPFRSTDLD
jgi:lipopolysaccharide export system ATP-binding protein